jgi:hypothetical protein
MPADPNSTSRPADQALDPIADLLFGLVAIIIPVVALMLPLIRMAGEGVPSRDPQAGSAVLAGELTIGAVPAETYVAEAAGLRARADGDRLVPLNQMLDDRALVAQLEQSKTSNRPLLLLIERDGHEAAFIFESLVAAHGPRRIFQVRVDPACAFVRDPALSATCTSASLVKAGAR